MDWICFLLMLIWKLISCLIYIHPKSLYCIVRNRASCSAAYIVYKLLYKSDYFTSSWWGCVSSAYPIILWWSRECVLYLIIIIKPEVWIINHCLGLGHETMVCAVCLTMLLWYLIRWVCNSISAFIHLPGWPFHLNYGLRLSITLYFWFCNYSHRSDISALQYWVEYVTWDSFESKLYIPN